MNGAPAPLGETSPEPLRNQSFDEVAMVRLMVRGAGGATRGPPRVAKRWAPRIPIDTGHVTRKAPGTRASGEPGCTLSMERNATPAVLTAPIRARAQARGLGVRVHRPSFYEGAIDGADRGGGIVDCRGEPMAGGGAGHGPEYNKLSSILDTLSYSDPE